MRFSMRILAVTVLFSFFSVSVQAVVDVDSSELQSAISIIFPDKNAIPDPSGYEKFELQSKGGSDNGIYAIYEAKLSSNLAIKDELPRLKLSVYSYANQDSAEMAFKDIRNYGSFVNGQKNIVFEDERNILYQSQPGAAADIFGGILTEDNSLHMLHMNGNMLFHASLYRNSGEYYRPNIDAFLSLENDTEQVKAIFDKGIAFMKLGLGVLYQPSKSEYSAISEKSSVNLSDFYSIPKNGSINFDLYINDPSSTVGTIFDSSGISQATEGDMYLYVNKEGNLMAGIYAPNFDSSCEMESGWYRITSTSPLSSYEWNAVSLHYGVLGFSLSINEHSVASCDVSQARTSENLYFGDFPNDAIYESMSGYINNLKMSQDNTEDGESWDDILSNQIFQDLSNSDPDVDIFQYLKSKSIIMGSEGYLRPDEFLNRAEMVKILLKAYGHAAEDGDFPFIDVSSDAWYAKYLATAYKIGIIEGHEDGQFLPGHQINRAEFYTILYRIDGEKKLVYGGEYSDVSDKDWFLTAAAFAASNKLVTSTAFDASALVSRRDAAKAIYALIK